MDFDLIITGAERVAEYLDRHSYLPDPALIRKLRPNAIELAIGEREVVVGGWHEHTLKITLSHPLTVEEAFAVGYTAALYVRDVSFFKDNKPTSPNKANIITISWKGKGDPRDAYYRTQQSKK